MSKQYHKWKHETHYAFKGKYILEIDGRKRTIKEGQAVTIRPGTIHHMHAKFGDIEVIEVSTPELWDVIRIEDDYGRIKRSSRQK